MQKTASQLVPTEALCHKEVLLVVPVKWENKAQETECSLCNPTCGPADCIASQLIYAAVRGWGGA